MVDRIHLTSRNKRTDIATHLRMAIVQGQLQAGQRVQTREELASHFRVSSNTVQAALARLTQEGFLNSKRKAGTFVSPTPPNLCNFAVVFSDTPSNDPTKWSRYYATLCNQIMASQESFAPRQIELHYGVTAHADNESFLNLTRLVTDHRLAALLFPMPPMHFENTPLLDEPGIARVMPGPRVQGMDIPTVLLDNESFMAEASARLAAAGLRKPAILIPPGFPLGRCNEDAELRQTVHDVFYRTGHHVKPAWVQLPDPRKPEAIRALIELLFADRDCPDGLILADDHYFAPVAAALATIPEVFRPRLIVAYQNFPAARLHGPVEVAELGFDSRRLIRGMIALADAQIAGEKVSGITIDAQFAEDISPS
jgi:DNA-binding LacI/PurR family transcriptional regulator